MRKVLADAGAAVLIDDEKDATKKPTSSAPLRVAALRCNATTGDVERSAGAGQAATLRKRLRRSCRDDDGEMNVAEVVNRRNGLRDLCEKKRQIHHDSRIVLSTSSISSFAIESSAQEYHAAHTCHLSSVSCEWSRARASHFAGKRVHFIGIGGCGMSGLARMLLDNGAIVTGSEPNPNEQTFELIERGVHDLPRSDRRAALARDRSGRPHGGGCRTPIWNSWRAQKLRHRDDQIRRAARAGDGRAVWHRRRRNARQITTTAMIAYALHECGARSELRRRRHRAATWQAGADRASSDLFVAEACEYDRSFHNLHPEVAVITNIEEDHLDCYGTSTRSSNRSGIFAKLVPQDGLIIANGSDAQRRAGAGGMRRRSSRRSSLTPRQSTWSTCATGIENGCYRGEVW